MTSEGIFLFPDAMVAESMAVQYPNGPGAEAGFCTLPGSQI
jgi:hypothetical protein